MLNTCYNVHSFTIISSDVAIGVQHLDEYNMIYKYTTNNLTS